MEKTYLQYGEADYTLWEFGEKELGFSDGDLHFSEISRDLPNAFVSLSDFVNQLLCGDKD